MFERSIYSRRRRLVKFVSAGWLQRIETLVLLACAVGILKAQEQPTTPDSKLRSARAAHVVTNVAQFGTLTSLDFLSECAFRLTGVITLVDTNRSLVVLQDDTGAVAVHFDLPTAGFQVGQFVSLEASRCCPYVVSFPDYPYRPSGWDVLKSFEAPMDWGQYHLTRMRAYLHPPVSGEYTFWIASDNSSELWLSPNDDPSAARKVASLSRYSWVGPHEWSRYPSQRSEPIHLEAGHVYYIEALQEQTTGGDHVSVAWQGPGLDQSVIGPEHLTPWRRSGDPKTPSEAKGVLREYWTDFSAGSLSFLTAPGTFEFAVSADNVSAIVRGQGSLPKPESISLNQDLSPRDNYRWVQVEGRVKFAGIEQGVLSFELSDGQAQVQVRAWHWTREIAQHLRDSTVRVEGVCEGVHDQRGNLVPGLIWVLTTNGVSLIESLKTNPAPVAASEPARVVAASTNATFEGFYASRGVVTFNDRVFGEDYLFVQEGTAVVSVSLKDRAFRNNLEVGQWVELGGALEPRKYVPVIRPLVVTELGWRSLPVPMTEPIEIPSPRASEGRWTELAGVVHSVNPDCTLALMAKSGLIPVWLGRTPSNELSAYVDSKLRVRGVLLSALDDTPLLLVPSRSFADVEEEAPPDPFGIATRSIAELVSDTFEASEAHRAKVTGAVTYRDGQSFVLEDETGGIRVQLLKAPKLDIGESVEVIGFPTKGEPVPILSEASVRSSSAIHDVEPKTLDLDRLTSLAQLGRLIHVNATMIGQKMSDHFQVLELQEQQRVFQATLANEDGALPPIAPGSRLKVVGVCDYETVTLGAVGKNTIEKTSASSLTIRLRRPGDVLVLSGAPWWTLRRTVALVGALLTTLVIALLWVHLLRRRLERQQAARLAFSRQILQGQETERQRIAVNLHDSLGQNLLVIKNQVRMAMQSSPDEAALRQRLNEISDVTSQSIEEVRQITHGLRPYQLDRLGLTQAIRASVSRASENSPISFASSVDDIDGVLDKESEIHVYRIVQEAVNNVVKHSAATEAAVVVKNQSNTITLSIRDNGCGFNAAIMHPSNSHQQSGYGLTGIAERVKILKGNIIVDSQPGQGASLMLEIPVPVVKA